MATAKIEDSELMEPGYAKRGFLPEEDPLAAFPHGSRYAVLDEIGRDLPSLLEDGAFAAYARGLDIPAVPGRPRRRDDLPQLRLYYVRLGFLASAYVNQVGEPRATLLPRNIAVPLCEVVHAARSAADPQLRRLRAVQLEALRSAGPDRARQHRHVQNFVHLYDEHWFILVHVEIEAIAARYSGGDRGGQAGSGGR